MGTVRVDGEALDRLPPRSCYDGERGIRRGGFFPLHFDSAVFEDRPRIVGISVLRTRYKFWCGTALAKVAC